jgi:6-phosphogluconolactonase
MQLQTRVFPDIDALSHGALEEALRIVEEAVQRTGRCSISLSGGHTPQKMFALWTQDRYRKATPWESVHLFWGDDRYVPHTDPLSNYGVVKRLLLEHVPIPAANVHPMPTDAPDPNEAARIYAGELRTFFGTDPPAFNVQFLGLSGDGHTASLFPGNAALEEKEAWCLAVSVPATPPRRLTLTYAILNQAQSTYFLVAGDSKRQILSAIAKEPDSSFSRYPAARVHPSGPVYWYLDRGAAGE